MDRYLKTLFCIIIFILGIFSSSNATLMDTWTDNGLGYYVFEKKLKLDDAADTLGIPPEMLIYGKVENGDNGDNEGVSWLNGTYNNPENEGSINITTYGNDFYGDPGEEKYFSGNWESDIPLLAYSLKTNDYTLLVELEDPMTMGDWDLSILWDWINDPFENENYDPKKYPKYPGLSNFVGYGHEAEPVPEPSTMLLLGMGLIGLSGLGRKKFLKKKPTLKHKGQNERTKTNRRSKQRAPS